MSPDPCTSRVVYLARATFRERVKKGPKNPISVVADKVAARGANPAMTNHFDSTNLVRDRQGTLSSSCPPGSRRWCDGGACPCGTRHRAPFALPGPWPARPPGPSPCSHGAGTGPYRPVARGRRQACPGLGRADLTLWAEVRVDACGPAEASPPLSASGQRECAVGHRPGPRARRCTSPPAGPGRPPGRTVARAARARATVPPSRCPAHGRPVPGAVPLFVRGGHRAVSTRGSGPGVKPVPAWGGADLTWRGEVRVDACGPGREASPLRRPAAGGSVPSATVRDPAPGPAGLPLRQDQGARQAARPRRRGLSSFPVSPQPRAAVRRGRPGGGRT